ncbi:MAG: YqaJ viral recombinase family protein [Coprobacillus sp.]
MNIYQETEEYYVHQYESHELWLQGREHSIGGSDASTLIGMNPYKTNNELWKEKKKLVKPKDVSGAAVDHGNDLEPALRLWFQKSHHEYEVQYVKDSILQSKTNEWQQYSPDGLLFHTEKGRGILEIKTTLIQNMNMYEQWKDKKIPMHYYIQVLHGLLVTKFDFVYVVAELRFAWERNTEIVELEFTREEVLEDLEWLMAKESFNWNEYYLNNQEPPTILFL